MSDELTKRVTLETWAEAHAPLRDSALYRRLLDVALTPQDPSNQPLWESEARLLDRIWPLIEEEVEPEPEWRLDLLDCPACNVPPRDQTGELCPFHEGYQRGGNDALRAMQLQIDDPEALFDALARHDAKGKAS